MALGSFYIFNATNAASRWSHWTLSILWTFFVATNTHFLIDKGRFGKYPTYMFYEWLSCIKRVEVQMPRHSSTVVALVLFKCWPCWPPFFRGGKITLWILMGWTCWNHLDLVGGSQMCWFLFQVRGSDQGKNTLCTKGASSLWANLGIFMDLRWS